MQSLRMSLPIALILLSGCAMLDTLGMPKLSIEDVRPRISGLDFEGVNLAIDLSVRNPYPVAIQSPRFKYALDLAGRNYLESEEVSKMSLPADGVGELTFPLRLDYADIWRSYQQFKDAAEVPFTLRGALLASPMGRDIELPLRKEGVLPILRLPKFSNIKLSPPDISRDKASVAVNLDLMNPNVFGLDLSDLGYEFAVGGVNLGEVRARGPRAIAAGETKSISLSGTVSGFEIVRKLVTEGLGRSEILPTGFIGTPYGKVRLPR